MPFFAGKTPRAAGGRSLPGATGRPRHTPETRGDQRRGRAWGLERQGPGEDRLRGGCDRVLPAGAENLAAAGGNRLYCSDFKANGAHPAARTSSMTGPFKNSCGRARVSPPPCSRRRGSRSTRKRNGSPGKAGRILVKMMWRWVFRRPRKKIGGKAGAGGGEWGCYLEKAGKRRILPENCSRSGKTFYLLTAAFWGR